MRNNVIKLRQWITLGLAGMLALGLVAGCASQRPSEEAVEEAEVEETSASEPAPEPEPVPEEQAEEPSPIPEAWFGLQNGAVYDIADMQGVFVPLSNGDIELEGAFASGYALGSWETSEYDEEWDVTHNVQTHFGLIDHEGQVAVDLDAAFQPFAALEEDSSSLMVAAAGYPPVSNCSYADDRMVVPFVNGATAVLDEQGKVVYTLGLDSASLLANLSGVRAGDSYGGAPTYRDNVLTISYDGGAYLVDKDGKLLVSEEISKKHPRSLGYGYYAYVAGELEVGGLLVPKYEVCDYSGAVAFDVDSVNKDDVVNAHLAATQPGAMGIVAVAAEKKNPYGGENKTLCGLYSISEEAWLVPLGEQLREWGACNEGVMWVRENMSGEDAAGQDTGTEQLSAALIDSKGQVILDSSTDLGDIQLPADFYARHLYGGYWQVGSEESAIALVYIENEKLVGAQATTANFASYPSSVPIAFWS